MAGDSGTQPGPGTASGEPGAAGVLTVEDAHGRIRLIRSAPELTLAQLFFVRGLWPTRPFCSGLGRCGHCLVYLASASGGAGSAAQYLQPTPEELSVMGSEELEQGGRLACRRRAQAGLHVRLPFAFPDAGSQSGAITLSRVSGKALAMAVDLGTTSLHWQVLDDRGVLAVGRELNPQLASGSEVMSRLGFALAAEANALVLQDVVLRRLREVVQSLPEPVERLCLAGNTVMTALLLGWPLRGLAVAPYQKPHSGGFWASLPLRTSRSGKASSPDEVPTYIPPLPAPFIGGDLSAGLAALHFRREEHPAYPYLLADLGTNGEFILALGPERYLAASVPMGPALEGIGMACGSTALPGVWVDVAVTPAGLRPRRLDASAFRAGRASDRFSKDEQPSLPLQGQSDRQRVSGTGYLALLAGLLRLGLMDQTGRFTAGGNPLARRIGQGVVEQGGEKRFLLGQGVYLTGRDVEEVLKVKAAFNLAFCRLLEEGGLAPDGLRAIYLAGALGEHVDLSVLEELGFVPPGSRSRIQPVGNTSLAGAALLVNSSRARDWIEGISSGINTLGIGQEPDFLTQFTQRLVFRHV